MGKTLSVYVRRVGAIVVMAVVVAVPVAGQSSAAEAKASKSSTASRTADGHPDLEGTWSFATLTPLERPAAFAGKDVLSADEATKLEEQAEQTRNVERVPKAGDPGGYNRFWFDNPTKVIRTRRTSLIVDPADGKVPALTAAGEERQAALIAARRQALFDGRRALRRRRHGLRHGLRRADAVLRFDAEGSRHRPSQSRRL